VEGPSARGGGCLEGSTPYEVFKAGTPRNRASTTLQPRRRSGQERRTDLDGVGCQVNTVVRPHDRWTVAERYHPL